MTTFTLTRRRDRYDFLPYMHASVVCVKVFVESVCRQCRFLPLATARQLWQELRSQGFEPF